MKYAVLIGILCLQLQTLAQAAPLATTTGSGIQSAHFKFTQIPTRDYRVTRDSELGNAQHYCARTLKKKFGDTVAIWSISANSVEKSRQDGSYSFQCDVAYFTHQKALDHSLFAQLEGALDYLPLETSAAPTARLIAKANRLSKAPYLQISIENIEPNQPLPANLVPDSRENIFRWITLSKPLDFRRPKGVYEFTLTESGSLRTEEAPAKQNASESKTFYGLSVSLGTTHPAGSSLGSKASLEIRNLSHPHSSPIELTAPHSVLSFPKTFGWSIATSAHQIEGGNTQNDWYEYERIDGKIFQGHKNENGPDHWNRIAQDVALLKKMGVSQYRMSIEWSRLETQPGVWDQEATRRYRNEILLLRKSGIEPVITLWHSTLPTWVAAKGGWEWAGIGEAFKDFAVYAQKRISPESQSWITLNEPLLYLMGAYIRGVVPPAKKGTFENLKKPLVEMLRAHALVYRAFHSTGMNKNLKVGIAHRMDIFTAYQKRSLIDGWLAKQAEDVFNWAIPNALQTGVLKVSIPMVANISVEMPEVQGTQDFYGLNYYTRFALSTQLMPFDIQDHPVHGTQEVTDMGWEVYPEGIYLLLSQIHQKFQHLPIMITENGIADSSDRLRPKYIRRHLTYLHHAIEKNIPVTHYSHWSLYDNLEWDQGFSIQCGLFEMDYKTLERNPRKSAFSYERIIKNNRVMFD